jgi:hypothetical protein
MPFVNVSQDDGLTDDILSSNLRVLHLSRHLFYLKKQNKKTKK